SDANREVKFLDTADWDIDSIAMTPYPSVMAYTINREGYSELALRKIKTGGKPLISTIAANAEKVPLPAQGMVGGLAFSKDQTKLAFSFNSSKQHGDVRVYDLKSKKLAQVTRSDRSGIDPKSFVAPELIKFRTFD